MPHYSMAFDVEKEDDPRALRQYARLLERHNSRLQSLITDVTRELAEFRNQVPEQLPLKLQELEQRLAQRDRWIFGQRSERRPAPKPTSLLAPGPEAPRKGHGPREQARLLTVEMEHALPVAERKCDHCGGQMGEMGDQFEESDEIDVLPPEYFLVRHKRRKYRCSCNGAIRTAPAPVKLQAGGRYSPAFAVAVAADKYLDHLPLERQVRRMRQAGLTVDSQTLYDQVEVLARALQPTYEAIGQAILQAPLVHADETSWKLLGTNWNPGKKLWAWAVVSPELVHYRILESRSEEAGARVLGGYNGIAMTDDYAVYEALARDRQLPFQGEERGRFQLVHCWAHARRKFVEVASSFPLEAPEILDLIGELYGVESKVDKDLPEADQLAQRANLRQTESRAIIQRIETWKDTTQALPQSGLGKAIAYMNGIWTGLTAFLDNPRIPLDNNLAERELRCLVLGRKNHQGSRSRRGCEVAGIFYTLLESARLSGKDPRAYLLAATYRALEEPGTVTMPGDWDPGPE